MDFGALPPEINSARMYTGAGAGPMMVASAAWNNLAAELASTASSSQAVIAELTGDEWLGPSSASMAAAAAPYVAWMHTTAGALQQAAAQAMASAAAYETAFAMTVPPPVIAANRAQLAALVATNFLGQNTPAIMATEAHYAEMWAQDAAAMYGYAASSASAAKLTPVAPPAPVANGAGLFSQAAAVTGTSTTGTQTGLTGLISNLPSALQGLANPLAFLQSGGILSPINNFLGIPFVQNSINGGVNTLAWQTMNLIPNMVLLGHAMGGASPAGSAPAGLASDVTGATLPAAAVGAPVLAGAAGPAASAGVGGGMPVLAGMGQASTAGRLSVPASWSAATPKLTSQAAALEGSGWTVEPETTPATTLPAGVPAMASATRGGFGFSAPRYGVKPTVMPKPVGVG